MHAVGNVFICCCFLFFGCLWLLVRVCRDEVRGFVEGSGCVRDFLGRYSGLTWWNYAWVLCGFFKWLRVFKGLEFSPEGFLEEHLRRRGSGCLEDRRWGLRLVLEFCRGQPGLSDGRRYYMFMVLKGFFDFHEAPLTSAKGVFGRWRRRKFRERQIDVERAKRVLGVVGQRERAVLMVMLQSGMSVGDVLNKFNFMYDYVRGEVEAGAERIRIDLEDRKLNGLSYFTFISRDAIHELRKWFVKRDRIVEKLGIPDPKAIFIKRSGKPLDVWQFEWQLNRVLHKHKLKDGPYSVRAHMFRKLFKTLARVPELAVDQDCVEFMMGHLSGIESVGGVYDKTPQLFPRVIEREYAKLEPYLNIFTGKKAREEIALSPEDVETLKLLLRKFKQGKVRILP